MNWENFRSVFEDNYYPSTYREAERDKFLGLVQKSLSTGRVRKKAYKAFSIS